MGDVGGELSPEAFRAPEIRDVPDDGHRSRAGPVGPPERRGVHIEDPVAQRLRAELLGDIPPVPRGRFDAPPEWVLAEQVLEAPPLGRLRQAQQVFRGAVEQEDCPLAIHRHHGVAHA